jgi:hypothetical protein
VEYPEKDLLGELAFTVLISPIDQLAAAAGQVPRALMQQQQNQEMVGLASSAWMAFAGQGAGAGAKTARQYLMLDLA